MRELFLKYRNYFLVALIPIGYMIIIYCMFKYCEHTKQPNHNKEISISQKSFDSVLELNTELTIKAQIASIRFDSAINIIDSLKTNRKVIKKETNDKISAVDTFDGDDIVQYWTNRNKPAN